MCAQHALNGLFQSKLVTRQILDDACLALTPSAIFSPHKSWIGLGNYDINVIMYIISNVSGGAFTKWFDNRHEIESVVSLLDTDDCIGLIINTSIQKFFYKSRHWYSIKKIGTHKGLRKHIHISKSKVYN
jgi:josephin